MDPETRQLLEETHALAKDTNRLLRAIRRGQLISGTITALLWIFAIVAPLYLYQHYLAPVLDSFYLSGGTASSSPGFFGASSAAMEKLINSFKAGQ